MSNSSPSIGILGAGITGLSIGWQLRKKGVSVSIYEKKDAPGGVIQTEAQGGWLWEKGPNTLMVRSDKIWSMLEDLQLNDQIVEANAEAKKRYILRDGKLHSLPMSLGDFIKTGLLSTKAKFRLLKEPFIPPSQKPDETIADFISRRLGKEVLDYAINPFVSGIFGGDPKKLSVKHTFSFLHDLEQTYGSLTKGMIKKDKSSSSRKALISFKDGLQALPRRLSQELQDNAKFNRSITRFGRNDGKWTVHFSGHEEARHDIIISTLPLHVFQKVFQSEGNSKLLKQLGEVNYVPLSVLLLGYRREQIEHPLDGFGMLIPERENHSMLGTLFSSSLFPGRAPASHELLTTFVGGARNPRLASLSKDELIQKIQLDLDQLLDISGTPDFVKLVQWKKAIPQYEPGYDKKLEAMENLEEQNRGLFLAGNFKNGVSVPDCITAGLETADKVALLGNT